MNTSTPRHRCLAQIHPQLRKVQPLLPLPVYPERSRGARPQTRTAPTPTSTPVRPTSSLESGPNSSTRSATARRTARQPPANFHSARPDLVGERTEESAFSPSPAQRQTQPQSSEPAPPPHTPLPHTAAEFAKQVLARHNSSLLDRPRSVHPRSTGESAGEQPAQPVTRLRSQPPQPKPLLLQPPMPHRPPTRLHTSPQRKPFRQPLQRRNPLAPSKVKPLAHRTPSLPLPNALHIGTITPSTTTTRAPSASTANSFRINTYTTTPQLLILNHLQKH
jgi:hypothetical protein